MKLLVYILAGALFILHQDLWFWDDRTLLFGFLPIGLGYHTLYSILAACVWALAVKFAWPTDLEEDEAADEAAAPPATPAEASE